jgi:hypothetical protein
MIFRTFSRRRSEAESLGKADPFQYSNLPGDFRVQVCHLLRDALGPCIVRELGGWKKSATYGVWQAIHSTCH